MEYTQAWSHPVYDPVTTDAHGDPGRPYRFLITQVLPRDGGALLRWQAVDTATEYAVHTRPHGGYTASARRMEPVRTADCACAVDGLENLTDYELWVEALASGRSLGLSLPRWVRPHPVPGAVVSYLHPDDYAYAYSGRSLATPSLVGLPGGKLLASHDVYWQNAPQNLSKIYESTDHGATWRFLCDLTPCFWGKLFWHAGALYMLACETEGGRLLLGRSDDEGCTWSPPSVLSSFGAGRSALPIVYHRGRLWTSMDAMGGTVIASADAQGDLLRPENWIFSAPLRYDPDWPGTAKGPDYLGFGEGNLVIGPDGALYDILRYETRGAQPGYGLAGMLRIDGDHPGAAPQFERILRFEGNLSKFSIARHEASGLYFAAVSRVVREPSYYRGRLSLMRSKDLIEWTLARDLLDAQAVNPSQWPTHTAFQYPDMFIEGDRLCLVSRTSLFGAYNYHNANYITYHEFDLSGEVGS